MKKLLVVIIMLSSVIAADAQNSKGYVKTLGTAKFAEILRHPDIQVLDVRTPQEFRKGYIAAERVINVDFLSADFRQKAIEILDPDKPVALYCQTSGRGSKAAKFLASKGFKVYNLRGGILKWTGKINGLEQPETTQLEL